MTLVAARFCRLLRDRGLAVTVSESLATVEALDRLDLADWREVYLGLRTVLTGSVHDYPVFDVAFRDFWSRLGGEGDPPPERRIPPPSVPGSNDPRRHRSRRPVVSLEGWIRDGTGKDEPEEESNALRAPSSLESLGDRDFAAYDGDELDSVARAVKAIAKRMARRPGRRWQADPRGRHVHLRRTVRRSLSTGGEAPELVYRSRRPRRTRVVALCGVSGSMEIYSGFLLQFLYALQNSFDRVETFVFATGLSRVTEELGSGTWKEALSGLGETARDFSGGTRIGESLAAFLDEWSDLLDRRTVVLILSDGWEMGDPDLLERAVEEIGERAERVLWLNPLAGSRDFRPVTRGMQKVLAHVEDVIPFHNIDSLRLLGRRLGRGRGRRPPRP